MQVFIINWYKNKQVQICQFYECVKGYAYENVDGFHPHSFYKTVNHCDESLKVFFLSKPTETLFNFKNNLAINVSYKK